MVMFEKPDWKCVFTYVQTFYRRFRNGRDPPAPTKKLTLTPPIPAPTINLAKSIEVSTKEPYYFPAPEITEEKKLSLMQKYLDLEDDKPKKKVVRPSAAAAPKKPKAGLPPASAAPKIVTFATVIKPKLLFKSKSKSLENLHAIIIYEPSLKKKSNSLPTVNVNPGADKPLDAHKSPRGNQS